MLFRSARDQVVGGIALVRALGSSTATPTASAPSPEQEHESGAAPKGNPAQVRSVDALAQYQPVDFEWDQAPHGEP